MRTVLRLLFVVLALLLAPQLALAQASIVGVVKDASGAVLPGVTVEAASPALIERVRSVSTNDSGQYRIEDLRPGTYSVTFTLPGFSTVKRDSIELTGTFAATINADLRVGTVSEMVTVRGETPVVDVVNAKQQTTLPSDMINAGLDASTVTPGSTAPDASLTIPAIEAWASTSRGASRRASTTSDSRKTVRIKTSHFRNSLSTTLFNAAA